MASHVEQEFKSPRHKLLSFFKKSRDGWKRKCQEAKTTLHLARNRIRDLEKSRARWRQAAQQLQAQVNQLEQEQARARDLTQKKTPAHNRI